MCAILRLFTTCRKLRKNCDCNRNLWTSKGRQTLCKDLRFRSIKRWNKSKDSPSSDLEITTEEEFSATVGNEHDEQEICRLNRVENDREKRNVKEYYRNDERAQRAAVMRCRQFPRQRQRRCSVEPCVQCRAAAAGAAVHRGGEEGAERCTQPRPLRPGSLARSIARCVGVRAGCERPRGAVRSCSEAEGGGRGRQRQCKRSRSRKRRRERSGRRRRRRNGAEAASVRCLILVC